MTTILEVRQLAKAFGGIKAVRDCSFQVEAGTITTLIGPNGAGKTTVFNLINNILPPDSGEVLFNGDRITGLRPHRLTRKGMGRTFQVTRSLDDMTVLENMVVGSPTRGLGQLLGSRMLGAERDRALELLDFVGIKRLADEKAGNLSYGQRKLLEFASIMMAEPRLVLLDEPAGGVNPSILREIADRIRVLNGDGVTFLIVEHNMDLVMSLSDTVVVMAEGTVLTAGSPAEVQSDRRVLDAYLGVA